MSKEQLYIQKEDIFEINAKEINQYIKSILNVLNNIPSKDNHKNLRNILIDNSLREIKEEP